MHVLHKLIQLINKMAEGAEQDMHYWKETVLFFLINLQEEN